jgi:hypothetical protein
MSEAEVQDAAIAGASALVVLPFAWRARRLELWRQDPTGRWRPHWRLPLAVRP